MKNKEKVTVEKYKCDECALRFKSKTNLDHHKVEHERLRHEFKNHKSQKAPKEEIEYEYYLPGQGSTDQNWFVPDKAVRS